MQFISIGNKCNTRYQINKHKTQNETLFFDWLSTDMDTVILVLQCKNMDTILTHNAIVLDPSSTNRSPKILINSLPYCISVHDLNSKFTDKDINDFINKYKRRHERIIQFICSKTKLCFIRYGKIENKQKELFIETIFKINPNCNFILVSINIEQSISNVTKTEHFLEINLNYYPNKDEVDWTTSYLDWKYIFDTISMMT